MPGIPMPRRIIPAVAPANKLHPLHSLDWVLDQVRFTGCYPDTERMTGRTTTMALKYIVQALENPHTDIKVEDHHKTHHSHVEMVRLIHEMTQKLGLKHFHCAPSRLTITFTNTQP